MINSDLNPEFINSFLDYSAVVLNKSINSVKEYSYDLNMFFKYMKIHFKLTKETDFNKIYIRDFDLQTVKKITTNDINAFLSYLALSMRKQTCYKSQKNIYNTNIFCLSL